NDIDIYMFTAATTGGKFSYTGEGSVTGDFATYIHNTNGGANARSLLWLGTTGGDPCVLFDVSGDYWCSGVDRSDSNAFKVSHNFTLGSSDYLRISTAGFMTIATSTQASLGTPANGTLIYCSDCNAASACTGGGGGAFASRQGGAWKCL